MKQVFYNGIESKGTRFETIKLSISVSNHSKKIMQVTINDRNYEGESIEGFGHLLNEIDGLINAEVWLYAQNGAQILLSKSAKNAVLDYMMGEDDGGVHSVGVKNKQGTFQVQLPYEDRPSEYPLAWCVELESAYKALSYFFVNDGDKPPFIIWDKDYENK